MWRIVPEAIVPQTETLSTPAGVAVILLADLFAAHGPDSAHIYRHEPAVDNTPWPDGEAGALPVGAAGAREGDVRPRVRDPGEA